MWMPAPRVRPTSAAHRDARSRPTATVTTRTYLSALTQHPPLNRLGSDPHLPLRQQRSEEGSPLRSGPSIGNRHRSGDQASPPATDLLAAPIVTGGPQIVATPFDVAEPWDDRDQSPHRPIRAICAISASPTSRARGSGSSSRSRAIAGRGASCAGGQSGVNRRTTRRTTLGSRLARR